MVSIGRGRTANRSGRKGGAGITAIVAIRSDLRKRYIGSSGNRVDESNGKCGLKPHGYWVFEVSEGGWIGHHFPMANSSKRQRRLWDTYTFPGFRPQPTVRGVFGDPKARIITLARRAKKRFAGAAGEFIRVGTTGVYGRFAICRAATRASSWRLRSGGCHAAVAAR